jgi:hypothetical protein
VLCVKKEQSTRQEVQVHTDTRMNDDDYTIVDLFKDRRSTPGRTSEPRLPNEYRTQVGYKLSRAPVLLPPAADSG